MWFFGKKYLVYIGVNLRRRGENIFHLTVQDAKTLRVIYAR